MTEEEKAEIIKEYLNNTFKQTEENTLAIMIGQKCFAEGLEKGLAEGRKERWHDLRKNPNDLPEKCVEVLVLYSNTYGNGGYIVNKHTLMYELAQYIDDEEDTSECYWVETGTDYDIHKVIAWCELPKFEE